MKNTQSAAEKAISAALAKGYNQLLDQITAWAKIWEMSDITLMVM
jgi:maltose phosphorylase